ncbi:hypothetical protein, partial [Rodentibacter heidelbergensis]|uniref:hypothetical protein n=1 Tax=Rodentibacter heidelbergensis TaxID=1908258 RepID=UPI001179FCB8
PHRLSDSLLKSKKQRRTVKLNFFTTVRRCVPCIIGIFLCRASGFCKKIEKNDLLVKSEAIPSK